MLRNCTVKYMTAPGPPGPQAVPTKLLGNVQTRSDYVLQQGKNFRHTPKPHKNHPYTKNYYRAPTPLNIPVNFSCALYLVISSKS